MQEIKNVSIFKCDFCGKKSFRKCDATHHEKWCPANPNNKHACFNDCRHLLRGEEEYVGHDDFIGKRKTFACGLTMQKMFSYIAERKRLPVIKEKDAIRMPVECNDYERQDIEDTFDFLD